MAWEEFIVGKTKRVDVIKFSRSLMDNIVELNQSLVNKTYQHGGYESFYINDPKRRHIHKASVRDRLLHHAIYRILYPFFDKTFIADSYSCRNEKGTHRAINRFRGLFYRVSKNHTRTCWVLKCDIRKFFASIDHDILFGILKEYIFDKDILWLLKNIIESFHTDSNSGVGLPLGNLTSQLFANVYMNKFDQWVKHNLKSHYYVRYADDFVFLSRDKFRLEAALLKIQAFLQDNLKLSLHPGKVFISTFASGMDFLGWVHFPDHRVLRNTTKQRMFKWIKESASKESLQSYLGLLGHGNSFRLRGQVMAEYWLWND
ncbi:MAG: reverse transcriptase/maturase family protein [Patescibacteria group bacterium]